MSKQEFTFKDGDKVLVDAYGLTGKGRVRGCATTIMPVVGASYIVEMIECGSIPSEIYPFKMISVFESWLTKIDE